MPLMEQTSCCVCGIEFSVPKYFIDARRADSNKNLHCPNGHILSWKESDLDRARRRAERAEQEKARLEDELNAASQNRVLAEKKLAKISKRIAGGVCPCCNRQFVNVHRHMKTKHPAFQRDDVAHLKTKKQ